MTEEEVGDEPVFRSFVPGLPMEGCLKRFKTRLLHLLLVPLLMVVVAPLGSWRLEDGGFGDGETDCFKAVFTPL